MAVTKRTLLSLLVTVMLVATACSNDSDFAELLQEEGIDFGDLGDGAGGDGDGDGGIDFGDLLDGNGGDNDALANALLEEITGADAQELQDNPLSLFCNDNDLEVQPPGWPIDKPPSMYASAYEMLGTTEYRIRGTSNDSMAVIDELRAQFAGNIESETVLSNIPGQQAIEWIVTGVGTVRFGETDALGACASVLIQVFVGQFPSEEVAQSASSASDAVAEGDPNVTTETVPIPEAEPNVAVLVGLTFYEIEVASCVISFDTVAIVSAGDVMLTVTGTPDSVMVVFSADGNTISAEVEPIVPIPGAMIATGPNGEWTVSAGDCIA